MKSWRSNKINQHTLDSTKDRIFLDKLSAIIEENINNEQFGIEDLILELNMSRTQIYRNLKKISNVSVSQYIREYRLEKAMELLQEGEFTASEVAYRVGFGSPTYFNKCFHDFYGFPPGKLKKINKSRDLNTKFKKRFIYIFSIGFILIVLLAFFIYKGNYTKKDKSEKTLAILPFNNLSPDPNNQYVCLGMAEEIVTHLRKIGDLQVKSRILSEEYNFTEDNIKTIAKELEVAYIVHGIVRKVADDLRITVNLYDGNTGENIWVEPYEGKYSEKLFEFQSNVARQVASSLNTVIKPEEEKTIDIFPTTNEMAYDFYLKARNDYNYYLRNPNSNENILNKAIAYYKIALEYDSTYALAYAGLGIAYLQKSGDIWRIDTKMYDSLLYLAEKAIFYNKQIADGHYLLGKYYWFLGNRDEANTEWDLAIKYEPNHWRSYQAKAASYMNDFGRYKEGLAYLHKAEDINKGIEMSRTIDALGFFYGDIGFYNKAVNYREEYFKLELDTISYFRKRAFLEWEIGNYDTAIEWNKRIMEIDSNSYGNFGIAMNYQLLGQHEKAHKHFLKVVEKRKKDGTAYHGSRLIGYSYLMMGDTSEALLWFKNEEKQKLQSISQNASGAEHKAAQLDLALISAALGEKEKAYRYLEETEERYSYPLWWLTMMRNEPHFDNIRQEQRFQQILHRIEEKYQKQHYEVKVWLAEKEML